MGQKAATVELKALLSGRSSYPAVVTTTSTPPATSPTSTSSKPLVLLTHDCTSHWFVRVEILTNALIVLETLTDEFDLVVVLNSDPEPMQAMKCKQSLGMLHHEEIPGVSPRARLLCDCHQLLSQASIPFIVAPTDTLAAQLGEGVRYALAHQYERLVLLSSTVIPSSGCITHLTQSLATPQANGPYAVVAPIFNDDVGEAVPAMLKLTHHYPISDKSIKAAAIHPLNSNYVAQSIQEHTPSSPLQTVDWRHHPPLQTLSLMCAMSTATAQSMIEGISLDLNRAKASPVGVHVAAYAVARAREVVLDNTVYSGCANSLQPSGRRSRTLVVATCAGLSLITSLSMRSHSCLFGGYEGVWHRTLSLILSLEGERSRSATHSTQHPSICSGFGSGLAIACSLTLHQCLCHTL